MHVIELHFKLRQKKKQIASMYKSKIRQKLAWTYQTNMEMNIKVHQKRQNNKKCKNLPQTIRKQMIKNYL